MTLSIKRSLLLQRPSSDAIRRLIVWALEPRTTTTACTPPFFAEQPHVFGEEAHDECACDVGP